MKLSICIPTFNFGAFIADTLDSIVSQLLADVEIVVLDGGSTDDTEGVVLRFANRYPAIRYIKQPHRGGIDRDMARSVELARGEYCWLFSSDDIMRPHALERILAQIPSGYDIYLCGLTICDAQMRVLGEHPVLDAPQGSTFKLDDPTQRRRYFSLAITTTAFFSFMGSIVIRRDRWLAGRLDEHFVGSCWAHVVRILRLIPQGLSVKYLGQSLQLKRGGNDSFMDKGIAHRFAIAIDGYHRIARDVFGDDSYEAKQMRRVIVNEFPPKAFFSAKLQCIRASRMDDVRLLDRLASNAYRDLTARNIARRIAHTALSVRAYEIARTVYRRIRGRRP